MFKWFNKKRCKVCGDELSDNGSCRFCFLIMRMNEIICMYHVNGGIRLDDLIFRDGDSKFRKISKV